MTTSIQSLDAPLAFRLPDLQGLPEPAAATPESVVIRTFARALAGMQKEALILRGNNLPGWRLVCDEGHYLNGTDLAPPPLAFFSAGMVAIFAASMAKELVRMGHDYRSLAVSQDAHYGMEGSALRGTMTASAESVVVRATLAVEADFDHLQKRLAAAIENTPVESLMRTCLVDTFSIESNGAVIATGEANQCHTQGPANPEALFAQANSSNGNRQEEGLVTKLESSRSVFEEDHGVGAALKDHQKRGLLIRSQVHWRDDGLQQVRVQIHKPIGSVFQFLIDEGINEFGGQRAPDGLACLSAGIAFCYMTQLGRYAQITRKSLPQYSVVQDTDFDLINGVTRPVQTHVHLTTDEDVSSCQKMVDMGEQTCFLHAACRMSNETVLEVECGDTKKLARS